MNRLRCIMLSTAVFAALIFSAMNTAPALADDGNPPPSETPVVEVPPVDVPIAAEEIAPTDATVADILAAAPEETDVVVVNTDGKNLPLASAEAAEVVASGDPQWCPAGVAPGSATCSGVKTSFNGNDPNNNLIKWLMNNQPSKAGVIWIEAGYDGTVSNEVTPIVLDGASLTPMSNYSLTINGGWIGGTTMNPNTPSTFEVPFSIYGWNNVVTINNILIQNVTSGSYALQVLTSNKVTLTNVDVVNNNSKGARIDNASGNPGNVVTINDSTFDGNTAGDGLYVNAYGPFISNNLNANNNGGNGVIIAYPFGGKTVTLNGANNFSFNQGGGIQVFAADAITLSNVTAIYNSGGSGAYLDNCQQDASDPNYYYWYCTNGAKSANVTIKGSSNFSNNGWDGLRILSSGTINLANITANNNGLDSARPISSTPDSPDAYGKGVFLYNYGSWLPKPINITGTNSFNGNASNGLFALGWSTIKVSNLTANDNGCDAVYDRDPSYCAGAYLDGYGVTLTGYGTFLNNGGDGASGLQAYSFNAPLTLNNLHADLNAGNGVIAEVYGWKPAALSILGTNIFNENTDTGLYVYDVGGAVTLSNITANTNSNSGLYVQNALKQIYDNATSSWIVVPAGAPVTLIGTNIFNENSNTGLEIHTSGIITTNNVTASFNGYGAYLDNCLYSGPDCTSILGRGVTMNGNNTFNSNSAGSGLYIESWGAIKVNNLTADNNSEAGAVLDNNWTSATGAVTIAGFSNTSGNGISGLRIYSHGLVTTSNLTANSNGPVSAASGETFYRGVFINNATDPTKLVGVTLLGVNQFNGNWNTGLQIFSYGAITLNNITANNNGEPYDLTNNPTPAGYGIKIDNSNSVMSMGVALIGVNQFNGNLDGGLYVDSKGAIIVNKVTANENAGTGVHLKNQFGVFSMPVTVFGYGVFNNNQGGGLEIYSNGTVTTNVLTANFNSGGTGVYIDNQYDLLSTSSVNVIMNGINTFNGNTFSDGLVVYSDGIITLNNITANDNAGYGLYVDNVFNGGVLKNIILNGYNTFVNNALSGLKFASSGAVTMTRITSDFNSGDGIEGNAVGGITLTCGSLILNGGSGYNLTSTGGIVTLKGVFSYGNTSVNFASGIPVITRSCPLP